MDPLCSEACKVGLKRIHLKVVGGERGRRRGGFDRIGGHRGLMYVENKNGLIDDFSARIGWVTFSKTGNTVYYRHLVLNKVRGGGVRGNFAEATTGDEYWISGVKRRGSNTHWAETVKVHVDKDAADEYKAITASKKS